MDILHPILCLIAFELIAVTMCSIQPNHFKRDRAFDDFVDETNIIRVTEAARSDVDCSRRCEANNECVAFYFTPETNQCQEHRTRSSIGSTGLISKPSSHYYYVPAFAVGELCTVSNCVHPSVRCVERINGNEYCHCKFGYEFDQAVGMCMEVCKEYSTNHTEFEGLENFVIPYYNAIVVNPVASFEACVNVCSANFPQFLSLESDNTNTKGCACNVISEHQQIVAHGALGSHPGWVHYNRPCVIPV